MYGATPKGENVPMEDLQLLGDSGGGTSSSSAVHPSPGSPTSSSHTSATDSFSHSEKRGFYSPLHYESIDFDPFENEVLMAKTLERRNSDDTSMGKDWLGKSDKLRAFKRWLIISCVGIGTALVASIIRWGYSSLSLIKYNIVDSLVKQELEECGARQEQDCFGGMVSTLYEYGYCRHHAYLVYIQAFIAFIGINLMYCLIACGFVVLLEPCAAGSGIPEIKCVLNGVRLPRATIFKTLVGKAGGIMFSVGGSLPVGKEGPMIHSGAAVADIFSQGSVDEDHDTGTDPFKIFCREFRNDQEKRDMIACGAAAGVAAAFGAPVGGVLFSMEEGASHWSAKLTWRAFFCAMMSSFTLYVVASIHSGHKSQAAMFSFGRFRTLDIDMINYEVYEILVFVMLGIAGGLLGALYNDINHRLSKWRMFRTTTARRKLAEVAAVSCTVSAVSFLLPYLCGECLPLPKAGADWSRQEKTLLKSLVSFYCKPDEYNELASLWFTEAEIAIKQLFHLGVRNFDRGDFGGGDWNDSAFHASALLWFAIPYLCVACWTYGISVPSGLFIPMLLSGAALGRLGNPKHKLFDSSTITLRASKIGHTLHMMNPGAFADPGTYALMGSAAMLGGMARMTISICVILLEATGDVQYGLPLMLTLMPARWVGNYFNEGLYDIHIHLKHVPFLEKDPPKEVDHMNTKQVMATSVRCFRQVEQVGVVHDMLLNCTHHCFPIVGEGYGVDGSNPPDKSLRGTVLRKTLTVLLSRKQFNFEKHANMQNLTWNELEDMYPNYPRAEEIYLTEEDKRCWINLTPYMNPAPYTIPHTASVPRSYRLFRTLGLRYLVVVNNKHDICGMITRKDLLLEHMRKCQRLRKYQKEQHSELIVPDFF